MEGEVGKFDEIRFIETPNAKVFTGAGASSIDIYSTLVFGMDAYGTTRISGEAMKNIVKPLGSAGSADPLDQRATSGWKATFVAKILNDAFITRIEHAVSA
jgi:N4-gp56 family major capsid protein